MEIKKLGSNSKLLPKLWEIYVEGFPENEKREFEDQIKVMRLPDYSLYAVLIKSRVAGLLAAWEFEDFVFIEHVAVKKELRGKGLGTKILKGFLSAAKKTVLLETDPPEATVAKKRIGFYEKCGMKINNYDYTQPAYSKEKKPVKMKIMSYPTKLTPPDFESAREKIHLKVYQSEKPFGLS